MGLDHVLTPLRRQVGAGQLGVDREVRAGAQQVGQKRSGNPVLLDRHGDGVGGQQATQVVDLGPGLELERLRHGLIGGDGLGLQHDDAGLHPAALHLLGEGGQSNLQVELRGRHEGPLALVAFQDAVDDEGVDGLAHGHAGDLELLAQFALGGHRAAVGEPVPDQVQQVIAHDDVLCRLPACVLGHGTPLVDSGRTQPGRGGWLRPLLPLCRIDFHIIMADECAPRLTLKVLSVFLVALVQTCSVSIRPDYHRHGGYL